MTHPARFAHPFAGGDVECRLCPHLCRLRPGQTGACRVRHNAGGELVTSAYGRPVFVAAEPVEKKYLFHAFPGARALSVGTAGCNMGCRFCINWRVSQADTAADAADVPPAEVVRRALEDGARAVALTYTEPTVFFEYAEDIAVAARAAGLAVVAKTNGFTTPDALRRMAGWLDAVNVDLKAWREKPHHEAVGAPLAPVLATLRLAARLGLWVEVSTLLVPGLNDTPADADGISRFVAAELGPDTPWHVQRFFPQYRMTDRPPTPEAVLRTATDTGRRNGLRFVYSKELDRGRMLDTACPGCGAVVLRRDGYRLAEARLRAGRCRACDHRLPGVGLDAPVPTPRTSLEVIR